MFSQGLRLRIPSCNAGIAQGCLKGLGRSGWPHTFCLDLQMLHVFAGYSLSFFCSPHTLDWDEDPEVDTVLEKGCGLDDKDADELGGDNEKCNQQAAATKKRAA